jgi:hypoxanthine phosphoribosyltransferase
MVDYRDILLEVLVSEAQLQARIEELGTQVSRDYAGQDLLLVCILRGGVMFLTDLMRRITIPHAIDFMAISSYGVGARSSSGNVRISLDLQQNIEGRHVLVVEDIVDTGHTIAAVLELLATRRPASLKICALLDKSERREVPVPIHYIGFDIPNKFVFGYGLDVDELFRNLPFIGVVKPDWYLKPEGWVITPNAPVSPDRSVVGPTTPPP